MAQDWCGLRMSISSQRVAVVLNAGSGDGSADAAEAALKTVFSAAGCDARITMLRGDDDLANAMAAAIADHVQIVVAGGGDGTVNAVANAIAGHDIALGVLPLGTLNHFAKDLGIPLGVEEAAAVIVAGHSVMVDVGEVNGRLFLNNSSLGLYPRIVQLRERYRARGVRKWFIATWATLAVTRRNRSYAVALTIDGRDVVKRTPIIFIGNNQYRMAGFDAGTRERLDGGQLAMYVVRHSGRARLLQLVWRILTGTARSSGDLAMVTVTTAQLDLAATGGPTQVPVAIDGELATMTLPLRYGINPGALRVIVPA
jgi:YegS/Rv2252/BmrU family lipid kinase